jgi:serine protease AprX
MALEIPGPLVEFILLGPANDRRQLQDSPILGDVWAQFASRPDGRFDLLITPFMLQPAGKVAYAISSRLEVVDIKRPPRDDNPNIAYLQGIVAAEMYFLELLRVVVPMTGWWQDKYVTDSRGKVVRHELEVYAQKKKTQQLVELFVSSARDWRRPQRSNDQDRAQRRRASDDGRPSELNSLDRYVILTGLILWAMDQKPAGPLPAGEEPIDRILGNEGLATEITQRLLRLLKDMLSDGDKFAKSQSKEGGVSDDGEENEPLVWQVSLNRTANPALAKSIPAVKADAAKTLFKVDTSKITWAVLDSGIDGDHPAFKNADTQSLRIKRSFDFGNFRKIVSLSNQKPSIRTQNLDGIFAHPGLKILTSGGRGVSKSELEKIRKSADEDLARLAEDAKRGTAAIHWDLVEKLVEIDPSTKPASNHGTHVAGILGASGNAAKGVGASGTSAAKARRATDVQDGMCPEINLFDFRVIGPTTKDTEFAIIGALQYIRYLNDRDNFLTIHGANLSLSIPHDVRNFACGRTPICNECERLVDSGVVVVAAAGNHGYQSFETKDGSFEGYAAFSITDPGNADGVLTVGATHRNWPHTYGISFFSSRGPTGDGRLKPDLVAPGERIRAPFPGGLWGDLDGTSMAAPHVSGAAAMLMARYSELVGQPRRIKRILCDTATDLGRERSFQGHGMLDVLRAFQSI